MAVKRPSTQQYLDIAEIRNDTVVLQDGSLRSVLLVSSLNFSLKSEAEQEALIGAYASFLNTLDFPLQIVIQSRRLHIEGYLDKLRRSEQDQTNDLLRNQIADYRDFVGELVKLADIMSKRFYVIVPYDPLGDTKKSVWTRIKLLFAPTTTLQLEEKKFQQRRDDLYRRIGLVMQGLRGMGLNAAILTTPNLIELFYETYNPAESSSQKISDLQKITVE